MGTIAECLRPDQLEGLIRLRDQLRLPTGAERQEWIDWTTDAEPAPLETRAIVKEMLRMAQALDKSLRESVGEALDFWLLHRRCKEF